MRRLVEFDHRKATQVINYFAQKEGGRIGKLKLIKLVYLADRYHLRKYGRPLLSDAYYAMPLGPVGSSLKDIAEFSDFLGSEELDYADRFLARGGERHTVVSVEKLDEAVFSESELEALGFSSSEFGGFSADRLVDLTHRYPEWTRFKSALESGETTRELMSYADFFGNPADGQVDKFSLDQETLAAAKGVFEEESSLSTLLK